MESSSTKIQAQKPERMKERRKRVYIGIILIFLVEKIAQILQLNSYCSYKNYLKYYYFNVKN